MKTITIRDIPSELAVEIARRSKLANASLNRTVLEMLTERQAKSSRSIYHDLDHLAGTWGDQDAADLAASLGEQRSIDPADWE